MIHPEDMELLHGGEEDIVWKKGVLLDISGGGVRMVSEYQEEPGCPIQLRFSIIVDGMNEEVIQYGKLIASAPNRNNNILYEQRVEFEQIDDKEREKIIRFIFDEERKKISKEKGLV
jgi:c-di-GMP-binding flagellar brake protein YcgR